MGNQLRNKDIGRAGKGVNPGQFAATSHPTSGIADRSDFPAPTEGTTQPKPLRKKKFTVEKVWGDKITLNTNDLNDSKVREVYTSGQCQALAYAIHEKTGWPILAVLDGNAPEQDDIRANHTPHVVADHLHHVLVKRPDGLVVDISGTQDLRDYLNSDPDSGFTIDDYAGRDEWLDEEEYHPEECLCTEQCYPAGNFVFYEIDGGRLWQAYSVSDWPNQNVHAARHYADVVLRHD